MRKIRSDKKRDVRPFVTTALSEQIHRLGYIADLPTKDVLEFLIREGVQSRKVIEELSSHFKRSITIKVTTYIGREENPQIKKVVGLGKERLSTRLQSDLYNHLYDLSYVLNTSVSTTCSILIERSFRQPEVLDKFAKERFRKELGQERIIELKKIIHYIEAQNPSSEQFNWMSLLEYFVRETKAEIQNFGFSVGKWIDKVKGK